MIFGMENRNILYEHFLYEIRKRGSADENFFHYPKGPFHLLQNEKEFAQFLTWCKGQFPNGIPSFLEIGTGSGGTIRTIYELIGFKRGLSIDMPNDREKFNSEEHLAYLPKNEYRYLEMNSHSLEAWLAIHRFAPVSLAFIDGDHFGTGVTQDMEICLGHMEQGGFLAFHDIESKQWPGIKDAILQKMNQGYLYPVHYFVDHKSKNPLGIGVFEVAPQDQWPSFK